MITIKKLLVIAFLLRLALSFIAWHPDVNNHIDWGIRFWQYGPGEFYSPNANVWSFTWPNQPPGTIYIYAGIRKLFEAVFAFFWFLNVNIPLFPSNIMLFFETNLYPALLKLPSLLADIGIAYLIWRFFKQIKKPEVGIFGAILFLANPAVWYNSAIWGQTDSVISFFGLLAFILLLERKLPLAVLAFLLSLYIKISLLVFLPIFLIILLKQKYAPRTITLSVLISIAVIGVVTLPFSQGEPFGWLFEIYQKKVFGQQLQIITANAFNFWAFLTGIHERPHSLLLGPLSYEWWGRMLFSIFYLPALYFVFKKHDPKTVFWALFITALSSFIFLTNMHERYLYPVFPVFAILAVWEKRLLWFYITLSLIHLINLYNFWWYPRFDFVVVILSSYDRLAPRIFGLVNTVLFFRVFFLFLKRHKFYGGKKKE